MAELHNGLLWRLEARKPGDALSELARARVRYGERVGAGRPMVFWAGVAAFKLLESVLDVKLDEKLQDWDVLIGFEGMGQSGQQWVSNSEGGGR